ncbi:MAG: M60 family metallopeptidase [Puniceicoccales bacterium]|jgi:hypothetical protein|nr:M60 family metallopeptidase [Puniceicoccales bacterium]
MPPPPNKQTPPVTPGTPPVAPPVGSGIPWARPQAPRPKRNPFAPEQPAKSAAGSGAKSIAGDISDATGGDDGGDAGSGAEWDKYFEGMRVGAGRRPTKPEDENDPEWAEFFAKMRVGKKDGANAAGGGAGGAAGAGGKTGAPPAAGGAMRQFFAPRPVRQQNAGGDVIVVEEGGLGPGKLIFLMLLLVALAGGAYFMISGERVTNIRTERRQRANPEPAPARDAGTLPEIAADPKKDPAPETPDGGGDGDELLPPDDRGDWVGDETVPKSPVVAPKKSVEKPVPYTVAAGAKILPADAVKKRAAAQASALDKNVWEKLSPTPQTPVENTEAVVSLAKRYLRTPFDKMVAHPVAKVFPGAVPDTAPRVARTLQLPANIGGWVSTGHYAAPGELVTLHFDLKDARRGLSVQIGSHSDTLFDTEKIKSLRRFPAVVTSEPVSTRTGDARLANPFGGLIYVRAPGGPARDRSTIRVQITGAVEAPYFKLGETTRAEWLRSRQSPAPWGELVCRTVVITVKSDFLRNLDDPERLMRLWEKIIDDQDWLAGWGRRETNPERLVPDEQLALGYMHSGYPVGCHLDACGSMTSYESLTTHGNWGFFHEYGHNHQSDEWTYAGYGETTCNIFAMYNMEKIADKKIGGPGNERDEFLRGLLRDPTTATGSDHYLSIYIPVIKTFGWNALQKTFAEFRKTRSVSTEISRMRRDAARLGSQQKRDRARTERVRRKDDPFAKIESEERAAADTARIEAVRKEAFVRLWSRHTGYNLGPYFARVGYPYTDAMKQSLSKYKPWMAPEVIAFDKAEGRATDATGGGKSAARGPTMKFTGDATVKTTVKPAPKGGTTGAPAQPRRPGRTTLFGTERREEDDDAATGGE